VGLGAAGFLIGLLVERLRRRRTWDGAECP
jgi:hypothetical protein